MESIKSQQITDFDKAVALVKSQMGSNWLSKLRKKAHVSNYKVSQMVNSLDVNNGNWKFVLELIEETARENESKVAKQKEFISEILSKSNQK